MNCLSPKDISILKRVAKPTSDYEFFVEPLLILLETPPFKSINAEGKTVVS